eukprot:7388226-Prymnesium_polylepis.1
MDASSNAAASAPTRMEMVLRRTKNTRQCLLSVRNALWCIPFPEGRAHTATHSTTTCQYHAWRSLCFLSPPRFHPAPPHWRAVRDRMCPPPPAPRRRRRQTRRPRPGRFAYGEQAGCRPPSAR